MQKVIIDTNVMVSALIQRGFSNRIVFDLCLEGKISPCVSDELMAEYYEVLHRPRFLKFPDFLIRAETLLADIELRAERYKPNLRLDLLTDKDDNMIIELADECAAEFIITGNTNDFTFSQYQHTLIVTPRQFWENYRPV